MKVIHLTHTDLDGAGCAVLSRLLWSGEDLETHFCTYGNVKVKIEDVLMYGMERDENVPHTVLITDLSIKPEQAQDLVNMFGFGNVLYVDHHPKSKDLEHIIGSKFFAFDEKRSATGILWEAWEDIHSKLRMHKSIERFVRAVNAWDMWQKEDAFRSDGSDYNQLLGFLGLQRFVNLATSFEMDGRGRFFVEYYSVIASLKEERDRYLDKVCLGLSSPYESESSIIVAWCIASRHISEVADAVLQVHDAKIAIIYNVEGERVHLRRSEDCTVDLGEVASKMGGGGHPWAASFYWGYLAGGMPHAISLPHIIP